MALIFGNEHRGISPELVEKSDIFAHIPMLGFVESLNISVACAICLYSSTLSKAKAIRRPEPVAESRAQEIMLKWLKDEIKGADQIIEKHYGR